MKFVHDKSSHLFQDMYYKLHVHDNKGNLITCTTLVDLWSQIKLGKLDGGPSSLTTLKNTVGNLFSESLRAEQYSGSSTRRSVKIYTSAFHETYSESFS